MPRARGEGSIYQRGDGRYVAAIRLPDGRRKFFYARSKGAARDKLTAAQGAIAKYEPLEYARQKLAPYLNDWLDGVRPRLSASTWQRYEELIRLHITPALGTVPLARLTPQQLQRFYAGRLAAGLSPRTVRYIHATLHSALAQALDWQLVPRNVAGAVDQPKLGRTAMQTLSAEQSQRLLEAATDDRLAALYMLAVTTGMRQGELLGLRWQYVDLDRASLSVRASLRRLKGEGFVFGEPKTPGSRRLVPLTAGSVAALRRHHTAQLAERVKAGPAWQELDIVFANEVGRPIEAGNLVRRSFQPLLVAAGLPRIRFHDLRHTAATLALEQGVPLKVVSEMLGHRSIGITSDLYQHVSSEMARQATTAMNALFPAR